MGKITVEFVLLSASDIYVNFIHFQAKIWIQQSPDLVTVNIVNIPGLVKELLLTILLLLLSKITVDLVKNLDLVKFFLLTKNFTKSGLYCSSQKRHKKS